MHYFLSWFLVAHAGSVALNVDSMEVNGQRVQALHCELESGGLFASMAVVGSLAEKKAELDACAPEGAVFEASWTWAGNTTSGIEVKRSSLPAKNGCVKKALSSAPAKVTGTCTALLLVGDPAAADAAAAALVPAETPSEEPADAEPAP